MGALRVARDLRLLPRRQAAVSLAQQAVGLGLEPCDIGVNVERPGLGRLPKLRDARLQLRDRLFEVEKGQYGVWAG